MPKEETIELKHIKNVIGLQNDLASLSVNSSLTSKLKALVTKNYGTPELIQAYGGLGTDDLLEIEVSDPTSPFSLRQITDTVTDGTYIYSIIYTIPGNLVKINISTFTVEATLRFDTGEDMPSCIYSDGTYLYVGLPTTATVTTGRIIKINIESFTKESTLTLDAGEGSVQTLISDGIYLYAGVATGGNAGKVVRINLETFTKTDTLTMTVAERNVTSLCTDKVYLYGGTGSNPAKIVKIKLSDFTLEDSITISDQVAALSVISDGTYLYFGNYYSSDFVTPTKVIKVDLEEFRVVDSIEASAMNTIWAVYANSSYLYFTDGNQIRVVDIATFTSIGYLNTVYCGYMLCSDGTYLYTSHATGVPGNDHIYIARIYLIPASDQYQRKIVSIYELFHNGTYYIYPSNAAGVTITSGAGAYTKGNYTEIIPVNTITTQFFITGLTISNLAVNTDYEIDIATGLAASEIIIATVSHKTDNTNLSHECVFPVPIKVSSNSRISARSSDGTGSNTCILKLRYKT